jgi:hypothetical protein
MPAPFKPLLAREICLLQNQPVEVLYVDNVETMVHEWERLFRDAGLAKDDSSLSLEDRVGRVEQYLKVKLRKDPFHFLDRYARATAGQGNGLLDGFLRDLSSAVMPYFNEDVDAVNMSDQARVSNQTQNDSVKLKCCRR